MAMIARVAEDKQNLLQAETVWQKMQGSRTRSGKICRRRRMNCGKKA